MNQKILSALAMLTSGTLMGTVGLYVTALGFPVYVAATVRGLFGTVFILLILLLLRKFSIFHLLKKTLVLQFLQGITSAFTVFFYFATMITSGLSIGAFLLYTGGIFALFFMRLFLKDTITTKKWVCFGIAIIGVGIIMQPWKEFDPNQFVGFVLGIISGVFLGCNILSKKLIFRKMEKIDPTYQSKPEFYIGMVLFSTTILTLLFIPFGFGSLLVFTPIHWTVAIFLGLIPTAIAFTLYNFALKMDTSGDIIILSYVEPIVASIIDLVMNGGLPTPIIIGGVLILLANIIMTYKRKVNQ
jgi:DME family drug/metabolite transporter